MRAFWAITFFILGFPLIYPGSFIWPIALLSLALLAGAIAVALSGEAEERRPVAYIFAWMCGFLLLVDAASLIGWTYFHLTH